MDVVAYGVAGVTGYLLGSLPTGYLAARARGVDIRAVGSGNIGATNVMRVLGRGIGLTVLAVDLLKGAVACWLLPRVALRVAGLDGVNPEWLRVVAGVAAILGHNYTCWLGFKGGKGIATTAGVLLALVPAACGLAVGLWVLVLLTTRYVSVASIAAALSLPVAVWVVRGDRVLTLLAAGLGALAIYKHKANLQRLRAGTEHRLGRKPPAAGPGDGDATRA